MPYPSQPHMHVCLTLLLCSAVSQVHIHKHTLSQTWVCAPPYSKQVCISGGLEGRERGGVGLERETGRSEREWEGAEKSTLTHFSLVHPLHLPSFPPFQELSKESLSPASQLQSSSVHLCHCVYLCNIYKYISISNSASVGTCFGRGWKLRSRSCFNFVSRGQRGACDLNKV